MDIKVFSYLLGIVKNAAMSMSVESESSYKIS